MGLSGAAILSALVWGFGRVLLLLLLMIIIVMIVMMIMINVIIDALSSHALTRAPPKVQHLASFSL